MSRRGDILWGIRNGLLYGAGYSVVVVLLYAVDGPRRFDKIGVPLGPLIVFYLLGGLSAGIVLGVFRSALTRKYSAFIVSVLAAIPVAIGGTVLVTSNATDWTMREWSMSAIMSLIMAVIGMAVFWQDPAGMGCD